MRRFIRHWTDRAFTGMAGGSIVLMALSLLVILGPLLYRGAGAVFFRGTVEFRKMQRDLYGRGSSNAISNEEAFAQEVREEAWQVVDEFSAGLDTESRQKHARHLYRQFKAQLRNRQESGSLTKEDMRKGNAVGRKIRNDLLEAYSETDRQEVKLLLENVLSKKDDKRLKGTVATELFEEARSYRKIVDQVDLTQRDEYLVQLKEVKDILTQLLGPRLGQPLPDLAQFRYGATRWDQAQRLRDRLIWKTQWVSQGKSKPLKETRVRRADQFAGTEMVRLFSMVEEKLPEMLRPSFTIYWQYFTDDSTPGHYFGGLGPEIIGTLLLTGLSMVFAIPLGVIAAAYLVECAGDNPLIRVLRTCINTLAGVPSIVFGLFGLAFFVLFLLPQFGGTKGSSILAGGFTLSVLVLPVIIRASEEAIRSVPRCYKEASLALGAGGLKTFVSVTLPAASPGILTGIILSMSRAAGETAPLLFTAAVALGPVPKSLFQPTRTLSYGAHDMAVGDRLASLVPHNQYGMIATLVILVLVLNLTAILIRRKLEGRLRGH